MTQENQEDNIFLHPLNKASFKNTIITSRTLYQLFGKVYSGGLKVDHGYQQNCNCDSEYNLRDEQGKIPFVISNLPN